MDRAYALSDGVNFSLLSHVQAVGLNPPSPYSTVAAMDSWKPPEPLAAAQLVMGGFFRTLPERIEAQLQIEGFATLRDYTSGVKKENYVLLNDRRATGELKPIPKVEKDIAQVLFDEWTGRNGEWTLPLDERFSYLLIARGLTYMMGKVQTQRGMTERQLFQIIMDTANAFVRGLGLATPPLPQVLADEQWKNHGLVAEDAERFGQRGRSVARQPDMPGRATIEIGKK